MPTTPWTIPHTDLTISPIALGLGGFGTRVRGSAARELLQHYLARGGNLVDTAHCYSAGLPAMDSTSPASPRMANLVIRT